VTYLESRGWETFGGYGTSHRKFKHRQCAAIINIQKKHDGTVKPYQVEQIRAALEAYTGEDKDAWLQGSN